MANKTIGELQAVPVGDLPVAPDIYDDTLIPVEQEGRARHMTGAQWKAYGVAAAKEEADRAEAAAIRQPTLSENNTWMVWDADKEAYVDTDLPARGEQGGKGDKGDPGEPGKNGTNGISPHVGANGTWFVGDTDTGIAARGPGIFEITTEPTLSQISSGSGSYTVYTLPLSTVLNEISGTTTIRAGDFLLRGYHLYRVTDVDDTTVEMDEDRVSLRGPKGPEGPEGERGPRGYDGEDGADGVGITSVTQTTTSAADGGTNVVTVTLTNGTKKTIQIKNGSKGSTGEDGTDGISPTVSVSVIAGGHRITITDANGTKTFDVMDGTDGAAGAAGQPGSNGADGDDGVGIASIEQTTTSTADGGNNVFTVTLTNGTKATFTVKNGSKGSTGETGPTGPAGADGAQGPKGDKGDKGATGATGPAGKDGKDGSDANVTAENIKSALGYTPANAADLEQLSNEKVDINAQTLTDAQKVQVRANIGAAAITTPPHKNTPHKPQTVIVNDCQDSTTYKGSGLTVNTTDHIMGNQCVNVSGSQKYIRFTQNTFDLKNNHLVIKVKINNLDANVQLYVKMKHTTSEANYSSHIVTRYVNANTHAFGEWREYTIPYMSYYTGANISALDYTAINDIIVGVSDISGSGGTGDFDIQFIGTRANTQSKGIVSFTFDDSFKTQYDGIRILAERGLTGTIFHIMTNNSTDYLTTDELKELVDYYGADIEVHGSTEYHNMTDEQLVAQWTEYQSFLKENGLSDGRHLAYPGGSHPTRVVNLAKKYFDSCRTIEGLTHAETYPPYDCYRMRALSSVRDSDVAKVKTYIDAAVENNIWLILVFHKIETGDSGMYCSPEALAELADYAVASGARVMNIAEVFDTNGGGSGVDINAVISALPVYNGEVE